MSRSSSPSPIVLDTGLAQISKSNSDLILSRRESHAPNSFSILDNQDRHFNEEESRCLFSFIPARPVFQDQGNGKSYRDVNNIVQQRGTLVKDLYEAKLKALEEENKGLQHALCQERNARDLLSKRLHEESEHYQEKIKKMSDDYIALQGQLIKEKSERSEWSDRIGKEHMELQKNLENQRLKALSKEKELQILREELTTSVATLKELEEALKNRNKLIVNMREGAAASVREHEQSRMYLESLESENLRSQRYRDQMQSEIYELKQQLQATADGNSKAMSILTDERDLVMCAWTEARQQLKEMETQHLVKIQELENEKQLLHDAILRISQANRRDSCVSEFSKMGPISSHLSKDVQCRTE